MAISQLNKGGNALNDQLKCYNNFVYRKGYFVRSPPNRPDLRHFFQGTTGLENQKETAPQGVLASDLCCMRGPDERTEQQSKIEAPENTSGRPAHRRPWNYDRKCHPLEDSGRGVQLDPASPGIPKS